jgi:hypothetical protein
MERRGFADDVSRSDFFLSPLACPCPSGLLGIAGTASDAADDVSTELLVLSDDVRVFVTRRCAEEERGESDVVPLPSRADVEPILFRSERFADKLPAVLLSSE